jgi:hypothetical protein
MWPGRRDYLRGYPFDCLGWYQYMVASRSAVDQALDFIECVGALRQNEFVVCDSEEGSGDQRGRVQDWCDIVDAHYGKKSTVYASESWWNDRLGGAHTWNRPRWVAAYRSNEPTIPHELWQHTDSASFAGLAGGVDGNLFHGTGQDFAKTFAGSSGMPAAPAGAQELAVGVMADGRFEVYAELDSGEVQRRWQLRDGGWHAQWESMGKPG